MTRASTNDRDHPPRQGEKEVVEAGVGLPFWVKQMFDHYDETGVYRTEDLLRALGDKKISALVSSRAFFREHNATVKRITLN